MQKKAIQDLRSKTITELKKMAMEVKMEIVRAKMEIKTAKIKNVKTVRNKRNNLARILTIINEKKLLEDK
jgi:ribosomal protein L29